MPPAYRYDDDDEDEEPRTRRPRRADPRDADDYDTRTAAPPKSRRRSPDEDALPSARSNGASRKARVPDPADDDEDNGWWVKHKDGTKEFIHDTDPRAAALKGKSSRDAPSDPPRDKAKDRLRKEKDGYYSDTTGGAPRGSTRNRRDDYDDPPPREKPKSRGKDYEHLAAGAIAGATAGAAASHASRRKKDEDSDSEDDKRRPTYRRAPRSRSHDDDRYEQVKKKPSRRDEYSDDEDDRRGKTRLRRDADRDEPYLERRAPAKRRDDRDDAFVRRKPRYDDDDEDDYDSRRGEGRGMQRSQSARYPSGRPRDSDRDRYGDDRRDPRDSRVSRKDPKKKDGDWKKTAGTLFMSQAMPMIQREGTKFLKKEMERRFAGGM